MGSIYLRNRIWWISYRQDGKTICKSLKTRDKEVAKLLKRQIEIKTSQGLPSPVNDKSLLTDLLARYFDYLKSKDTAKHVIHQALCIRQFQDYSEIHYLNQIRPHTIEKYLATRKSQGLKPSTIKHDLVALKSFLTWAVYNGYLAASPAARIKAPRLDKKPPLFLSQAEARRLLEVAKGDLKAMIAISLYTGIRRGELLRLKWEDFDFKSGKLLITQTKSGRFRVVAFNPKLKTILRPFIKPTGRVFDYKNILRGAYEKALKAAGISLPKGARWHVLRHSYASWHIQNGIPITTVSKLLGHTNISTTQIYSHLSDKHLEDAGKSLSI